MDNELRRIVVKPYGKDCFETVGYFKYKDVEIHSGYITDGASIPRIFWWLFEPHSPEYLTASVIHDYLTDNALRLYIKVGNNSDFKVADDTFKEVLELLGVAKWKVMLFYLSVRAYHILKYGRDKNAKS